MAISNLTRTDLHLIHMHGNVVEQDGYLSGHVPDNPGYRWGNFLLLDGPPAADELESFTRQFHDRFHEQDGIEHVTLRWDGDPLDPEARKMSQQSGMHAEGGLEMRASTLREIQAPDIRIEPLDLHRDWDRIVEFDLRCDPTEREGEADYVAYKQGLRRAWKSWADQGGTTWWAAHLSDQLVGMAGLVCCPDNRGRFQDVKTHPDHRRRGVCSTLVSTIGNHALRELECSEVLLGADPEGPAMSLYRGLGFTDGMPQRGLVLIDEALSIREESEADRAEVKSIIDAAFGSTGEAALVAAMRNEARALSLVAVQSGTVLGHAFFTVVTGTSRSGVPREGIALGPIAVRPSRQREGVGSALVREGLARCQADRWSAAFVLGDPGYYGRFGWKPAVHWNLDCKWDDSGEHFQALELHPGALDDWHGTVHYHPAFDRV